MKTITAFLKLVRWQNLLFIVLTQFLFLFCIEQPIFTQANITLNLHQIYFIFIVVASVCIAAAGNIINDYFDLNIDHINKPNSVIVDKIINRRVAIMLHIMLSLIGVVLSFIIDYYTRVRFLGIANFCCTFLLFFYSSSLKKKFLIGNVLISLLTAWVILVITYSETNYLLDIFKNNSSLQVQKLSRITFLYVAFAFIISLIREVVKDMEDIEGDRQYGCKTMPIVWGTNATKVFIAVWLIVLIAALIIIQFYVIQFRWWLSIGYCYLFIIFPLIIVFIKLYKANSSKDYHDISSLIKLIMLTGILSMIFFKLF